MDFLRIFAQGLADLLREPPILMGIVALVGLIAQRKAANQVVSGTVKTIAGFMIMATGAGMVAGVVRPISAMIEGIIGLEVTAPGMGTDAFLAEFGGTVTMIMAFGFLVNVFLARVTPFKFIFLTGHQIFWMSFVYVAMTVEVIPDVGTTTLLIFGSLLLGLYLTLAPAAAQPFMRKVTGNDDIAYGHTTTVGVIAGSLIGRLFATDKEKTSEDIKVPEKLDFLKDITVSTTIVMVALYLLGVALTGSSYVMENLSGGEAAFLYAIKQGFAFGIGLTILLMGVSMMIAEIVPAFKGISEKIVPNAKPALDCPVVFNFAPTAVMLGFLSCLSTVLLCMVGFGAAGWYALTPPVITTFFGGGPAGVFGNSTGGWKGAIAAGILAGLLMSFGQALTVPLLSTTVADFARWSNDFDYSVLTPIYHFILSIFETIFN